MGLSILPPSLILPGLFVIAVFISTSMGTSMGTIGALVPIALGFAEVTGLSLPLAIGAVVGGAMAGDNLSIISDTTIAATRTQGVGMRDKFRLNLTIALPAMLLTLVGCSCWATPAFSRSRSNSTTVWSCLIWWYSSSPSSAWM
ncbi:Na+/H+ antiporter NhaC family protein [Halopseudomonas pachastrellae]|nr:Na+/H+ antiporter NhaC family protein [Halopseudomonas pachastrellae]